MLSVMGLQVGFEVFAMSLSESISLSNWCTYVGRCSGFGIRFESLPLVGAPVSSFYLWYLAVCAQKWRRNLGVLL